MNRDFEWKIVPANTFWPSNDGIPSGEEWELFIHTSSAGAEVFLYKEDFTAIRLCGDGAGVFHTYPSEMALTYAVGPAPLFSYSMASKGFKLTGKEKIKCIVAMMIRARKTSPNI